MKTALYTTFYPAANPYLQTWADSVATQTNQDFDLWIAVDNVSIKDVSLPRSKINWLHAKGDDTPASLRQAAFEEIIQAYDVVIFVDSDDVLLPERVATAKEALKSYDVYGCALELIDTNGESLGHTFTSPRADWPVLLSKYNIFGLSNTAYRTETLASCLPFPSDTVMVDWLLITNALANNAQLVFDQTPHMLYRQYPSNTAKVLPPYTDNEIRKATTLVLEHYKKTLNSPDERRGGSLANVEGLSSTTLNNSQLETHPKGKGQTNSVYYLRTLLEAHYLEVQQFSATTTDSDVLARYTKALNALKPVFLWWECVAHPELENIWK